MVGQGVKIQSVDKDRRYLDGTVRRQPGHPDEIRTWRTAMVDNVIIMVDPSVSVNPGRIILKNGIIKITRLVYTQGEVCTRCRIRIKVHTCRR